MDDKKMKELMIDYIDGRLTGELKVFVEKHINKSDQNRQEFEGLKKTLDLLQHDKELEPDSSLRMEFISSLNQIEKDEKVVKMQTSYKKYWQLAAVVSVFALILFGGLWYNNQQNKQQLMAMQKELENTRSMIMIALDQNNTASQRIMGVNASYQLNEADDAIVEVLIKTMNEDENSNVRIAAINALAKFSDDPAVKKALIESLTKQNDPIVQITLINLMVTMKEKSALDELEKIIKNSDTDETVKDEAHMATFKLS